MHGLRIKPLFRWACHRGKFDPAPLHEQASLFAYCFRSILPALDPLFWITASDSFHRLPTVWHERSTYDATTDRYVDGPLKEFEALELQLLDGHVCYAPGLLPRYAEGVTEDWNELFGFVAEVEDPVAWIRERYGHRRVHHVASTVEVCFFNIDAAFWEIHTRNLDLVNAVRQDLEGVSGLALEGCDLRERFNL